MQYKKLRKIKKNYKKITILVALNNNFVINVTV